jgi:hypothetical protein
MTEPRRERNLDVSEMIRIHLEMKAKAGEAPAADAFGADDVPEDIGTLPPRNTLFPSNRRKLANLFYNSLLVLFILLVLGLTAWGFRLFGGA